MPIISNIASKLAGKYLGEYFDGIYIYIFFKNLKKGFENKNIEASLTSGEAIFHNLTLKASAIDQLNLPLSVKEGTNFKKNKNSLYLNIGSLTKLTLQIPWRSLGSEPTIVRIQELLIILGPKPKTSVLFCDFENF